MPRRRATSLAVFAAAATGAGLLGCGGEPDPVTDRDGILRLELGEYRIEPQNIRVRPGRVRILARNVGTLTHNLKVRAPDRERGEAAFEYGGAEGTAFPGERISGELFLRAGEYELVCTIANHDDLGQTGRLIVGD